MLNSIPEVGDKVRYLGGDEEYYASGLVVGNVYEIDQKNLGGDARFQTGKHTRWIIDRDDLGKYEIVSADSPTDSHTLTELQREVESLRKDLRTFAEQSTETAHELKALGKDVAKMDESIEFLDDKIAGIVEGMYADSRKDFTPAERLQYAIASGASAEEVRSFYDGFTIAIVEYSDGLDSLAPGKLTELRELVAVYREFTKSLSKGSGGE